MIKYKSINDYQAISELWNRELGFIYPIASDVLTQNITNYPSKYVLGAYDNEMLIGFVVGKKNITNIASYQNLGWISIIYVARKYRNQGIGSHLLTAVEEYLQGVEVIHLGKDVNNFFPGIPVDFNGLADRFFINRGYEVYGTTHDLINTNLKTLPIKNKNIIYKQCTLAEQPQLLSFMKRNFPGRWTYEVEQYFINGGDGNEYIIGMDGNNVIGFARANDRTSKQSHYNITWYQRFKNLGGIGPLGVDSLYRGKDIGYDIVAMAVNTLINRGISEIIIDWTSLLSFYRQFGFEVWKSFKYLSKKG